MIKKYTESFFKSVGFIPPVEAAGKFEKFFYMLKEWNKKFNLTNITCEKETAIKHFVDSLFILSTGLMSGVYKMIDTGSGAGFPGIPLSIVYPDKKITLLDANNKKKDFLLNVKKELELDNTYIIRERAENISRLNSHREKYDICISRALAKYPVAAEISIGLVKKNGYFCYYASRKQAKELIKSKIYKDLGAELQVPLLYSLPDGMGEHAIIIVKKLWKTGHKYPREFNKIKAKPLAI